LLYKFIHEIENCRYFYRRFRCDFEKTPQKDEARGSGIYHPPSLLGTGIPSRIPSWEYRRTVKEELSAGEFSDTNACGRKRGEKRPVPRLIRSKWC